MSTVPNVTPITSLETLNVLSLLEAELDWAMARVRRLHAQHDAEHGTSRTRWGAEDPKPIPVAELRRREANTRRAFQELRSKHATPIGLDAVQARFGLNRLERHTLLLTTGLALQRSFGEALGDLDGNAPGVCMVEAIFAFEELDLEGRVSARANFRPGAPLFAQDLAQLSMGHRYTTPEQLLDANVSVTSRGLELVLGTQSLAEELLAFSTLETPRATLDQVVLPPADRVRLLAMLDHRQRFAEVCAEWGVDEVVRYGRGTLMLFTGPPGTGKTSTAHGVAHRLGQRVLNVDIPTFSSHGDALRFLPSLFREARIHNAVLFFDECESLFESRRLGNALMTLLLTELERFEGVAVLATNLADRLDEALDRRVLVRIDFPRPDTLAREHLWRLHLPPRAAFGSDLDTRSLASRHDLAGGYIKNAMLNAIAAAVSEDPELPVLRQAHLENAARDQARRPAVATGAHPMSDPRATLDHVCLPAAELEALHEIVDAAQAQRTIFDRWGVGAHQSGGRGVVALFVGPPGTGKTFSAEAISGTLGRPMMRVVLPSILSKWVGEAERSLATAFREAEAAEAVLLLDEVDSLLMARGLGQASRHDDALVNTLLDLLDRHQGVVILCTNRAEVLDAALDRRVGWKVQFPEPDAEARLAIWTALVPATATGGAQLNLGRLATRYSLTGGRIRTASVRAAVRAARLGRAIQLHDLERSAAEEAGEVGPNPAPRAIADA